MRALNANPHSLWHDIIVTNTESAANMNHYVHPSIECWTVPRERARPTQALSLLPSARHARPDRADWTRRLPPATNTLGRIRAPEAVPNTRFECSATLNLAC